jgi:hypothetical protein
MRQAANLAQQKALADMREKGINDRFKETMEWNKYKWDHPQPKTSTGSRPGTKKPEPTPVESSVSRLSTNSFEDWTTQDMKTGETVKVLSNAGLSSDINKLRDEETNSNNQLKIVESQMKDFLGNRKLEDLNPIQRAAYDNLKVRKESIQSSISKTQSDLNTKRGWYKASIDAVLNNNYAAKKDVDGNIGKDLTPDEIALYKKYQGDIYGTEKSKRIKELEEKYPWVHYGDQGPAAETDLPHQSPEANAEKKELADYLAVKKKIDQRRDNFLAQMRYTPIDTDAVQLGTEDSKTIAQMIFSNPQGLHLYDNAGNKTDKLSLEGKGISWFNPKGDNYKMSMSDNSLINYMSKHNVVPVIEQVGNTTKIGTGNAVVKVSFKDPNGEIPTSPFYIEVTPQLQKYT